MKNLLKKAGASLAATLLLVIASQAGAFAQGGTSESLSPAGVIGGVALIVALVVLLAVKGSHSRATAHQKH